MTVSLKHSFHSPNSDGADANLVQPSNWNAEHTLTCATSRLLGRTTAGTGAVEELSVGTGLTLATGSLSIAGGTYVTLTGVETLTNKTLSTGNVVDAGTSVSDVGTIAVASVGFRGTPQVSVTTRTLALTDAGKQIAATGTVTIPSNASVAFPIGTTIVVYNNSAADISIAITSDTLRLAGSTTTGTRTLSLRGVASLLKVNSTEWVATGNVT